MKSRASIRGWYLALAISLLIVVQLFAVTVSGVAARNSTIAVAQDAIGREGDTTIESVLRYLEPAEQSIEVTARLLENDILDPADQTLESYLATQLAVLPQVTGAFVGFPDGAFVFVNLDSENGFSSKRITMDGERVVTITSYDEAFGETSSADAPDDTYDPRERPWYQQSQESFDVAWTDPYVFFTAGTPGVTASKAVVVDGVVEAVVGVDVALSGLSAFLDDLSVTGEGDAFVVSGDNVLATPTDYEVQPAVSDDGSVRLPTAAEASMPAQSERSQGEAIRLDGPDGPELVLHRSFPPEAGLDWSVVIRAPQSEFTSAVSEQQRLTFLIGAGGTLLVLLGSLLLIRMSRPLDDLQAEAETDPLTGIANRRQVDRQGSRLIAADSTDGTRHAVLVLDLDNFKSLNDEHGHHAGDQALAAVSAHLRSIARPGELVGRLGGDEFVFVFETGGVQEANEAGLRILLELTSVVQRSAPESANLTVSGGLAISDEFIRDFEALLREADEALLIAKRNGEGTLRVARRLIANMR